MANNPWEKADELRAEAHKRYAALNLDFARAEPFRNNGKLMAQSGTP
ncbi:hypothetical protein WME75_14050 [Sorangium sp. So ce1014]